MRKNKLEELQDRVRDLESDGTERRENAIFTDRETQRIKEIFDERAEVHAGRAAIRLFLWALGAAAAGAATTIFAYLGFRK